MVLTKDSKETVQNRIRQDRDFAISLLDEAISLLLNGESKVARLLLRDIVNATIGFEALSDITEKPSKSLHRMLSANGNPTMDNLIVILQALRQQLNVEIRVQVTSCT